MRRQWRSASAFEENTYLQPKGHKGADLPLRLVKPSSIPSALAFYSRKLLKHCIKVAPVNVVNAWSGQYIIMVLLRTNW